MPRISRHRNSSKTYTTPKKPFTKPRLDAELKLCGEYGLKCKREIYRARYMLAKIRRTARDLLTLDENDIKRRFEGAALLRRLHMLGILDEEKDQLDYVLGLRIEDIFKRRLQSVVVESRLAKSVHHARNIIKARHISVGGRIVNIPSYMVRISNTGRVAIADTSSLGPNGKPGRTKRAAARKQGGAGDDE